MQGSHRGKARSYPPLGVTCVEADEFSMVGGSGVMRAVQTVGCRLRKAILGAQGCLLCVDLRARMSGSSRSRSNSAARTRWGSQRCPFWGIPLSVGRTPVVRGAKAGRDGFPGQGLYLARPARVPNDALSTSVSRCARVRPVSASARGTSETSPSPRVMAGSRPRGRGRR